MTEEKVKICPENSSLNSDLIQFLIFKEPAGSWVEHGQKEVGAAAGRMVREPLQ